MSCTLSPTPSCFSAVDWAHQSDGHGPAQNLPSIGEGDRPGLDTRCLGHLSALSLALKLVSNDSNSPAACRGNNSIPRPSFSSPAVQEQPRTGWRSGRCQNEESDPQPLPKGQHESCFPLPQPLSRHEIPSLVSSVSTALLSRVRPTRTAPELTFLALLYLSVPCCVQSVRPGCSCRFGPQEVPKIQDLAQSDAKEMGPRRHNKALSLFTACTG